MRRKLCGITCLALVLMATAASAEGVTRLESLRWDDQVLSLNLDGPYQVRTMILDEPDRVVIDFPDVRSTLSVHDYTGSGAVTRIRVGQNEPEESSGLRCRVVVDLTHKTEFHITESGTGIAVSFSGQEVPLAPGIELSDRSVEVQEYLQRETVPVEPSVVTAEAEQTTPADDQPFRSTVDLNSQAPTKTVGASAGQLLLGAGNDGKGFTIPSRDRLRAIASGQAAEAAPVVDPQPTAAETTKEIVEPVALQATDLPPVMDEEKVAPTEVQVFTDTTPDISEEPQGEPVAVPVEESEKTPAGSDPMSLLDWLDAETDEPASPVETPREQEPPLEEAELVKPIPETAPVVNAPQEYTAAVEPPQVETPIVATTVSKTVPVQQVKPSSVLMAGTATGMMGDLKPKVKQSGSVHKEEPVEVKPESGAAVSSSGDNSAVDSADWYVETSANVKRSSVLSTSKAPEEKKGKAQESWSEQIRRARKAGGAFTLDSEAAVKPDSDPISLEMRGAEFKTLLRAFADFSGKNIISGQDVKGKVSVKLKAVPWFEGLQAVCGAHGYGIREEFGILRVAPTGVLEQEEMERLTRHKKRSEFEPMVTKMVELRFAVATDLTESLQRMLSERGKVDVDERSNTLMITDVLENVDRVIKIAEKLDHTIPQVEITARIVDVDYYASRDMGIRWDALDVVSNTANVAGSAMLDGTLLDPTGEVKIGTIQDWGSLSTTIQAMEKENKANVISNPRVMTMDNIEATILVGKKIPLIVADEAGNAITQLTTIGIKLKVTPHINSDGQVMMDLHTEVSDLASEATVQGGVIINTHESTSNVMVDNQQTAVIAGLIRTSETNLDQKVPFLGKIPLVKHLFGYENNAKNKRELIIFVTPRVVENMTLNNLDSTELDQLGEELSLHK